MIFQTRSYTLVNAILNHPDVSRTFSGRLLGVSGLVNNPHNIIYACEHGLILFLGQSRGVYEGHVAFLAGGRGKVAVQACKDALDHLFTHFDASAVVAAVPLRLRNARMLCRLAGLKRTGADDTNEFFAY